MASTSGGTSYWNGLRASLTDLVLDIGRAKYVDVERVGDDRNIPDQADLRYGATGNPIGLAPGGLTIGSWVLVGVAIAAAGWALRRAW